MADIILAAIIVLGIIIGFRMGTINILGSLGSLVLGFIIARKISADIAVYITKQIPSLAPAADNSALSNLMSLFINTEVIANRIVQILVFIVIIVVVSFLVKKVCRLLSGVFDGTLLGAINKMIGAFLGFVFIVFATGIVIEIFLPVFAETDWGASALSFIASSTVVMPFINSVAAMVLANLPNLDLFSSSEI